MTKRTLPPFVGEAQAKLDAMTWQPIETAPGDGTIILAEGGTVEWRYDGWFSHSAQGHLNWEPRVWMPYPEPPHE